jgi:hypothetical protein
MRFYKKGENRVSFVTLSGIADKQKRIFTLGMVKSLKTCTAGSKLSSYV